MVSQQPNLTVIGRAAAADEFLSELTTLGPDVILLDLCLVGREGLRAAQRIQAVYAGARPPYGPAAFQLNNPLPSMVPQVPSEIFVPWGET